MNTRKSMKLPIIITLILIVTIVVLFTSIKQTTVTCNKTKNYNENLKVQDVLIINIDRKKINNIKLTKSIKLFNKLESDNELKKEILSSLHRTLDYLEKDITYNISDKSIDYTIYTKKKEIILLDNLSFENINGKYSIKIDSNTKSKSVFAISVGDNYTDGELMKSLKEKGFSCK